MSETPDRPHRTGAFWLDMVVAVSAVAISIVSLWVASRSDQTQERLLAASVWPYVEFYTSNFEDNQRAIHLSLRNAGVGPARIRWMTIDYKGKPMADPHTLFDACCSVEGSHALSKLLVTSTVTHTVIVPHEERNFISVPYAEAASKNYAALEHARSDLHVRVCYCSALDNCWLSDNETEEDPKPVSNCLPIPANTFEG